MPIRLMPLPYKTDALEPAIGATTLEVHHGKHHKAYVDKTNQLTEGTDLADKPLEAVIAAAQSCGNHKLLNQAAQAWNHGFYWTSLSPEPGKCGKPLSSAIDAAFGSAKAMQEKLVEEAAGHFGSGWAWLVADDGKLSIETTHDAGQPGSASANPLLVIDVWEHAYYLDRKNDRKAYLNSALGLLDWVFASENYERGSRWTYPA